MGSGIGWRCKKCGAGKEYCTGYGMRSSNVSETRKRIERGELGVIAKHLLSGDCPLEVNTIDEVVFYRCRSCEKLVEGANIRFCAEGGPRDFVLHVPPEECPDCGAEFTLVDECTPVSEGEIEARVEKILREGCPECGNKAVEPTAVFWD